MPCLVDTKRYFIHGALALLFVSFSSQMHAQRKLFDITRFENTIKAFEAEKAEKGQIVLYGSSSFALWKNYGEDLAPYKVINRGFGGSTMAEALYYFDRVIVPLKPKLIVIYEGENDLAVGFTLDSIFKNYISLVQSMKKKLPGTKLAYVSTKISPSRKHLSDKIKTLNGMIRGYNYSDKNLYYIDITPLQNRLDGSLDPVMFKKDSLHVSDLAYRKWAIRFKDFFQSLEPQKKSSDWVSLFNGKDFTGWEKKGALAQYEIVDGVIVGISDNKIKDNTFLCTQKLYTDFVLELEVQADTMLNSGIQFRSNSIPTYLNGRVHGYQMEIDPSPRRWSGGIYDEARRGWLYRPENDPAGQKAFDRYGWNRYRIEAKGQLIKTFVNGIPVADYIDTLPAQPGFIALQVHGLWKKEDSLYTEKYGPMKVRWRNIRIMEW